MKLVFSMVVDNHAKFHFQAFNLAQSLIDVMGVNPCDVFLQFSRDTSNEIVNEFSKKNYTIKFFEPFGDGKYCNKLIQLETLSDVDFDKVILLDTDTIIINDFAKYLNENLDVEGKIVDLDNPSCDTILKIFDAANLKIPEILNVDVGEEKTVKGNFNGGFYAISKGISNRLGVAWKKWALFLLHDNDFMQECGKQTHIDQVSFAMACADVGANMGFVASNLNYFTHFSATRNYYDKNIPICMLHYHDVCLGVLGLIEAPYQLNEEESVAIKFANNQISNNFNNLLFWNFRYACFPERGSGIGSRGENAIYKRQLLIEQGIEEAESIIDFGCGDLEVLSPLKLNNYLGIDRSLQAINVAKSKRPDLNFLLIESFPEVKADLVICFEVSIHQPSKEHYLALINNASHAANKTLIISGYDAKTPHHMVYFYEPLEKTLRETNCFTSITKIGAHTDVCIYRCEV